MADERIRREWWPRGHRRYRTLDPVRRVAGGRPGSGLTRPPVLAGDIPASGLHDGGDVVRTMRGRRLRAELGQQDAGVAGETVVVRLHVEQLPGVDGLLLSVRVVHGERSLDDVAPVRHGAVAAGKLGEKGTEVGSRGEAVEVRGHGVPVGAADVGAGVVVHEDGEVLGCCVHGGTPSMVVVSLCCLGGSSESSREVPCSRLTTTGSR